MSVSIDSVSRLVRQNNTGFLEEMSKSAFIPRHRRQNHHLNPDLIDTYNLVMIKQEDIFSRAHGGYMNSCFTEEATQMTNTHEMLNSKHVNSSQNETPLHTHYMGKNKICQTRCCQECVKIGTHTLQVGV